MKPIVQTLKKTPPQKSLRRYSPSPLLPYLSSFSEHKQAQPSLKQGPAKTGYLNLSRNHTKNNEETTARFNSHQSPGKPHPRSEVKSLIEILYKKINSVAASTQKFLSSAEKLSRYCEFSRLEAKQDLRNYQSEKTNIEKELINISAELQKPLNSCENQYETSNFCFENRKGRIKDSVKKSLEKDRKNKTYQTPPSKEKENADYPKKTQPASRDNVSRNQKEIDYQNIKTENEFLKQSLSSLMGEHKTLQKVNLELNKSVSDLKDSYKRLAEKYSEKKVYIKKLLDILKPPQGCESEFSKAKRTFESIVKSPIKTLDCQKLEEILISSEQELSCVREFLEREGQKSLKTRLIELRRKKKEAEGLLFNEKVTKDQYNSLLEILRSIQNEEKELEEKEKGHEELIALRGSVRALEENIGFFKTVCRDVKVIKKKLKLVKTEKKTLEKELSLCRENQEKMEAYYQGEFSKLSEHLENIEKGESNGDSRLSELMVRLGLGEGMRWEEGEKVIASEFEGIRREIQGKNDEIKQMRFELDRQHNENEGEVNRYRKEMENILNEKLHFEERNKELEGEIVILHDKLSEVDRNNKSSATLCVSMEEELTKLRVELNNLRKSSVTLQSSKEEELAKLRSELNNKHEDESLMNEFQLKMEEFKALEELYEAAQGEVLRLENALNEKERKIKELTEGMEKRGKKLEKENVELKEKLEHAERTMEGNQKLVLDAKESTRNAKKDGEKARNDIAEMRVTIEKLRSSLSQSESSLILKNQEIQDLQATLTRQRQSEVQKDQSLKAINQDLERFKSRQVDVESLKREYQNKSAECECLKQAIEDLRASINGQLSDLEKPRVELAQVQKTLKLREQELEGLKSQNQQMIKQKNQEIENLRANLKAKTQEYEELIGKFQSKSSECENLKQSIEDLRGSINSQLSDIEKPRFELSQVQKTLKLREQELEGLKNTSTQSQQTLKQKNQEIEALRVSLKDKTRDYEGFESIRIENESLKCRVQELEGLKGECEELRGMAEMHEALQRRNHEIEICNGELMEQQEALHARIRELETVGVKQEEAAQEILQAIRGYEEKEKGYKELENKLHEYEFIIQTNEIRIRELEDGGNLRSLRTEEGETPAFASKREDAAQNEEMRHIISTLQNEREVLLCEFNEKMEQKDQDIRLVASEYEASQKTIGDLRGEIQGMESLLEEREQMIGQLTQETTAMQSELEKNAKDMTEVLSFKQKLEGVNSQLENKLQTVQQNYNNLTQKMTQKEAGQKTMGDLRGEIQSLESLLQEKENIIGEMEQKANAAQSELERKTLEMEEELALKQRLQGVNSQLESNLQTLQQNYSNLNQKMSQKEASLKSMGDLRAEIQGMEGLIKEKDRTIVELTQKANFAQKELERKTQDFTEMTALKQHIEVVNSQLESNLQTIQQNYSILTQKMTQKELAQKTTGDLNGEIQGLKNLLEEKEHTIMDLSLKANALQNECERKAQELSEVIGLKQRLEGVNSQLESNFRTLQQNYSKLAQKVTQKEESQSNSTNGNALQMTALKTVNGQLQTECEGLRQENEGLHNEVQNLQSEVQSLQEKITMILEKNVERPPSSEKHNSNSNNQEFKNLLGRYQLLSREYEEINGIIREMIREFFPAEHCSESHSTRTLLVQIQRVIRQRAEEMGDQGEEGEGLASNEMPKKSHGENLEGDHEEDLNKGFNKGEEEEMDMENEIEEYRMIIKHMEIALKDKEKEIKRLNKLVNANGNQNQQQGMKPGMNPISEKDEEEEEEKNEVPRVEYVEDKYKLNQAEITRLNKENEELRYLNEQLTSNLEKMQEEVNDMQLNEEKFMQQIKLLKEEIDALEKRSHVNNNQHEKEHIKSIFFKFLEELNNKNVNKGDIDNYLQLLFSLLGVNEQDRDQHGLSSALFKSFDKKKSAINSFFKK